MNDNAIKVNAFLSHGYGAVDVNLFFQTLISTVSDVTFRVDRGNAATSTTRLERMIRDCQAFIGIWPVPAAPGVRCSRDELLRASRYFRLELDIAVRARKPAIIFSDHRYGNVLRLPSSIKHVRYDAQEIRHGSNSGQWTALQRKVDSFFRDLTFGSSRQSVDSTAPVGLLLPDQADIAVSRLIRELVSEVNKDTVDIRIPLDGGSISAISDVDWAICAIEPPEAGLMRSFLYGQSIPVLRLQSVQHDDDQPIAEDVLFDYLEVGYRKDVTRWNTEEELLIGLRERLATITEEPQLIGDAQEAADYFALAAKRKSKVFLSYAGEDREIGTLFSSELKKVFQDVFDYRDNQSLRVGEFWQDQLNERLSRTAVGVVLLSDNYVRSDYCMHEARQLHDGLMRKRIRILPVKLDAVEPPPLLSALHYARLHESSPAAVIAQFLASANPD